MAVNGTPPSGHKPIKADKFAAELHQKVNAPELEKKTFFQLACCSEVY